MFISRRRRRIGAALSTAALPAEVLEQRVLLTGAFAESLGGVVIPATPVGLDFTRGGIWLDDHFEVYGSKDIRPAAQSFNHVTGAAEPVTFFMKLNPDGNESGYQGSILDATILDDGSLVYVGDSDGYFYATEHSAWLQNATYWTDPATPQALLSAYPYYHPIYEVTPNRTWIEVDTYGTLGDDTFTLKTGGAVGFQYDISEDSEYIIGSQLWRRDEFGFYDAVDISGFDYSEVGGVQPTWFGIEGDSSGNYFLNGHFFNLATFVQQTAFWDINGQYLGSLGTTSSSFHGFAEVEGQMVAAVNVFSPETNQDEGFLVRLPDFQVVAVEDLIGRPAYFGGSGGADDIFASDDALGLLLRTDSEFFVTAIRTFDVPPRQNSVALFDQTTGIWTIGHTDNGTFTQVTGPRWSTAVIWETMTGDFNDDGRLDLAGRQVENGHWWIALDQGDGTYQTTHWGHWSPLHDFVDVTVADFNNDGLDDIAGRWTTGHWFVSLSNGTRFTTQYAGRWSPDGWADVVSGDFNGDGMIDFAGRQATGQWWFGLFNGNKFVNNYAGRWAATGWQEVLAGDFNGDGLTDLAGLLSTGQWWQGTSNGARITNSYKGLWNDIASAQMFLVDDFDGDGRDDIAMLAADDMWYVNTARDVDNNRYTQRNWGNWSFATGWHTQLGDFNRDGLPDIAGYLPTTGQWHVLISRGTVFENELYSTWNV